MITNFYFRSGLLLFTFSFPLRAIASDFNVLTVGLSGLTIALILVFLCIKGSAVARKKQRNEVALYPFGSLLLTMLGIAIVLQELPHMSSNDFYGFIAMIAIPGALAFVLPLFLSKSPSNESDQE